MKHSTPDSMKFKRLQRRLGESKRGTVGLLELLWIAALNNAKRGDIGRYTNEEIAIECDWEGDPDDLVDALIATGWLDESSEHRLVIHDWPQHAPRYVHAWIKSQNTEFAKSSTVATTVSTTVPTTVSTTVPTIEHPTYNQTKPNQTKPIKTPPPPPEPAAQPHSAEDPVDEWAAAADLLFKAGIERVWPLIDRVRGRTTPDRVSDLVENWRANRSDRQLGVGALVDRISNDAPGLEIDRGWPDQRGSKPKKTPRKPSFRPIEGRIRRAGLKAGRTDDEIADRVAAARAKFEADLTNTKFSG